VAHKETHIVSTLFFFALFAIIASVGAGLILAIRRLLDTRFPIASGYVAFIASALSILVLTPVLRIEQSASYSLILIATFLGTHWTQPHPWSVQGLCRSLAAVSGIVAIFASIDWAPTAIAVSVGVTGGLVYLAESYKSK
jgi:hypothetical protein